MYTACIMYTPHFMREHTWQIGTHLFVRYDNNNKQQQVNGEKRRDKTEQQKSDQTCHQSGPYCIFGEFLSSL
eukprot:SAG31_NODE_817_length_11849_cov_6.737362_11_plen_72_part_00